MCISLLKMSDWKYCKLLINLEGFTFAVIGKPRAPQILNCADNAEYYLCQHKKQCKFLHMYKYI